MLKALSEKGVLVDIYKNEQQLLQEKNKNKK